MAKRKLIITVAVLVGVLALGGVVAFALAGQAEARYGEGPGYAGVGRTMGARGRQSETRTQPAGSAAFEDGLPAGELDESEIKALNMALDDEYKAWSVYDQVIADLGTVRPFTSIQKAEENHIAALVTLFERHGLEVPVNTWPGNVPVFETLDDACEAGVQAEIDNAALYDELFSMVNSPIIERVFTALQRASQTKHLPTFERCAL
jgi:rubrerythrin